MEHWIWWSPPPPQLLHQADQQQDTDECCCNTNRRTPYFPCSLLILLLALSSICAPSLAQQQPQRAAQTHRPTINSGGKANLEVIQRVVETYFSPVSSYGTRYTPCAYPAPSDLDFQRRCFISDRVYAQNYMCNLDGAISNTEMDALVAQLNKTFAATRSRCECESTSSATTLSSSHATPTTAAPPHHHDRHQQQQQQHVLRTRPSPAPRRGHQQQPENTRTSNNTRNTRDTTKSRPPNREDLHFASFWPPPPPPSASGGHSSSCWYKIGLAFISHLPMPTSPLPLQIGNKELCNNTEGKSRTRKESVPPFHWTRKEANKYGMKFAKIVRERWNIGQCGEDILLLVVIRRPDVLGDTEENKTGPIIFASFGHAVEDRTADFKIENHLPLAFILKDHNRMLADQDQTKLKYYLSALLDHFFEALSMTDQLIVKPSAIKNFAPEEAVRLRNKQHIPDWALAVFGGCALLLIVMGLGLCLVKSRLRRGASRAKPGADGGRRWKAGFVGGTLPCRRSDISASDAYLSHGSSLGGPRGLADPYQIGHVNVMQKIARAERLFSFPPET